MCDPRQIHLNSEELMDISAKEDLGTRLARLPVPSHYLRGFPGGTQGHSLGLLKAAGVPLAEIPDAGHWPFIDQPDRFAEKILGFIEAAGG
jgi:pimeloyl-ACP methyl ester carboxylesterase